jgi:hypothetical protein
MILDADAVALAFEEHVVSRRQISPLGDWSETPKPVKRTRDPSYNAQYLAKWRARPGNRERLRASQQAYRARKKAA